MTGLEVKDGSEADIVTQIRRYQKNQAVRKGLSAEVRHLYLALCVILRTSLDLLLRTL